MATYKSRESTRYVMDLRQLAYFHFLHRYMYLLLSTWQFTGCHITPTLSAGKHNDYINEPEKDSRAVL